MHEQDTGARSLSPLPTSLPTLYFPAHSKIGKGSSDHRGAGDQVKMAKGLGLAVVSTIFCVGSVVGKFVQGIVNTKEVRSTTFPRFEVLLFR